MLSFTGQRNLFGTLTNDTSSSNLTTADTLINLFIKKILSANDWNFLERTGSITTVASTQFYNLPFNFKKLMSDPYVTISSTQYPMKEAPDRQFWDRLNEATGTTSTIHSYYFIFNGQMGFYPKPSTASYTITVPYYARAKDLTIADYTTGNITTTTNGGTTVTGTGTTWTTKMADRWIRITDSDTANAGDGVWYEISSVTSATVLELKRGYNGAAITAGSASYIIGQMSLIPEDYQDLPVYGALWLYFTSIMPDASKAAAYKQTYQEGIAGLFKEHNAQTSDPVITGAQYADIVNPNLYISL